jgi:hypothetical protein
MKVAEDAAQELPLNDERAPKPSRHVVIALNHLNKRRQALLAKRAVIDKEVGELDQAILALE